MEVHTNHANSIKHRYVHTTVFGFYTLLMVCSPLKWKRAVEKVLMNHCCTEWMNKGWRGSKRWLTQFSQLVPLHLKTIYLLPLEELSLLSVITFQPVFILTHSCYTQTLQEFEQTQMLAHKLNDIQYKCLSHTLTETLSHTLTLTRTQKHTFTPHLPLQLWCSDECVWLISVSVSRLWTRPFIFHSA